MWIIILLLVHIVVHLGVVARVGDLVVILIVVRVLPVAAVVTALVDVFVVAVVVEACVAAGIVVHVVILMRYSLVALEAVTASCTLAVRWSTSTGATWTSRVFAQLRPLIQLANSFHGIEFHELEATLVQLLHQSNDGTEYVLILVLFLLFFGIALENQLVHLPVSGCLIFISRAIGVAA